MKNAMRNTNRCSTPGCFQSGANFSGIVRSHARVTLTVIALMATFCMAASAKADTSTYNFSITPNPSAPPNPSNNVSNINASGVITVSNTVPAGSSLPAGSYVVTGITGTFSDSLNGISGTITGLEPASLPTFNPDGVTFSPPAKTSAGFSYDNLFWPGGDSEAVCLDAPFFFGGDFDVYGMAFDVTDGSKVFTVDLWSNGGGTDPGGHPLGGYQLNDSAYGSDTPNTPNEFSGLAYGVNVSTSPTPEPESLLLVGTGLSGIAALLRRRKTAI